MVKRLACLALALSIFSLNSSAQAPKKRVGGTVGGTVTATREGTSTESHSTGKQPWQWTDDERIRLYSAALTAKPPVGTESTSAGSGAEAPARLMIDGRKNPELLMPSQLMSSLLISLAHADRDAASRDRFLARYTDILRQLRWDAATFWARASLHARTYNNLVTASPRRRSEAASLEICRNRVAALHDMRAQFPGFDEFLYRAIAPTMALGGGAPQTPQRLGWLERGCQ